MKTWKCSVLLDDYKDNETNVVHYVVCASTEADAQQLAFALDGGWNAEEKDASQMMALAQAHVEATECD